MTAINPESAKAGRDWAARLERRPAALLAAASTLLCVVFALVVGCVVTMAVNAVWLSLYDRTPIVSLSAAAQVIVVTAIIVAYPILRFIIWLLLTLRRTQRELAVAAKKARAASDMKSAFLASTSHEIRTPLNGILGMAQVLQRSGLPATEAEQVDRLADASRSLSRLLGDILDISKVEAGRLEVAPTETDFRSIIEANASLWGAAAKQKGLRFTSRFADDAPRWVVCDGERVRQCIANLTSNAIKFTQTGSVEVSVEARRFGAGDDVEMIVSVADTGPGLSAEEVDRLFTPFEQVGPMKQRRAGTGLGLAISRHLARVMGGDVTARARPGKGSTFVFVFAAKESAPPKKAPVSKDDLENLPRQRLLVTDDNETNRTVARLLLRSAGHDVSTAESGAETLEMLSASRFDAVLLDMNMPDMDGPETVRRLRAAEADAPPTRVIALTADAMSGDRARYLAMGLDGYAAKPIELDELLTEIARVVGSERPQPMIDETPAMSAP